jgi:hypothetical protein
VDPHLRIKPEDDGASQLRHSRGLRYTGARPFNQSRLMTSQWPSERSERQVCPLNTAQARTVGRAPFLRSRSIGQARQRDAASGSVLTSARSTVKRIVPHAPGLHVRGQPVTHSHRRTEALYARYWAPNRRSRYSSSLGTTTQCISATAPPSVASSHRLFTQTASPT